MIFHGREEELKTLKAFYEAPGLKGAILYGRRRQGKSCLLRKSREDFKGSAIYYQCLKDVDRKNASSLIEVCKSKIKDFHRVGAPSFSDVLAEIFYRSKEQPILLILDEYPYLQDREKIDSFLQRLRDNNQDSKRKIILSGSYVDIRTSLIDIANPLHGRFALKRKINSFDYKDSSLFYPDATDEEKIGYYSVFGGTPYYLARIDPKIGLEENIKKLFLNPFSPLEREINSTIETECSKITNATFLLSIIASGKHSYTDINSVFRSQVKNSDINYLLSRLINRNYVQKEHALNDKDKRKAYYKLSDNLISFYYHIIYPNIEQKTFLSPDRFFDVYRKEKLYSTYIPKIFEKICKEYLLRKNRQGKLNSFFTRIGSYTYNNPKEKTNGQFDIVTEDLNGLIFYECKYTSEKVGMDVISEEKEQLSKAGLTYYKLGFFSKSGFQIPGSKEDYILYNLHDLFC